MLLVGGIVGRAFGFWVSFVALVIEALKRRLPDRPPQHRLIITGHSEWRRTLTSLSASNMARDVHDEG